MEKRKSYLPPKMLGNGLLDLETAILAGSDLQILTNAQEYVEMDEYNGDYWE